MRRQQRRKQFRLRLRRIKCRCLRSSRVSIPGSCRKSPANLRSKLSPKSKPAAAIRAKKVRPAAKSAPPRATTKKAKISESKTPQVQDFRVQEFRSRRQPNPGRRPRSTRRSAAFAKPIPSRRVNWNISIPTRCWLRSCCRRRRPTPASTRRRARCFKSPTRRKRCWRSARTRSAITSRPSGSIATRPRTSSRCRKN